MKLLFKIQAVIELTGALLQEGVKPFLLNQRGSLVK